MAKELYFVAIVPGEPVQSEAEQFKMDLHRRFGTKAALKAPAHITLFAPFRFPSEREAELLAACSEAMKKFEPFSVKLDGFGAFSPRVIFLRPGPPDRLADAHRLVRSAFCAVEGVLEKKEEPVFHPHMTVANRDWNPGGFEEAFADYRQRIYQAEFTATRIELLRLGKGRWQIIS